jgi:hypothetical protein
MITLLLIIAFTELDFEGLTVPVILAYLSVHPFIALCVFSELASYFKSYTTVRK